MSLRLVTPASIHEPSWRTIIDEIEAAGEKMIPYALKSELTDYQAFMKLSANNAAGVNLQPGWVANDIRFLVDGEDPTILGAVDIRLELNDYLFKFGGHIGYGVRPSERRKGYAGEMLRLALNVCREKGMDKVLITCVDTNIGSAKTILKNGGVFESEIPEGDIIKRRYWITLS